jgi:O-antigen/teichoic acid export membrane protein
VRILRSPTLVPVFFYAASGGGYALANLLLARWLPERDYALFTLVLAMMNLGAPLAAAGLDGVAVRGRLRFVPSVSARIWLASSLVALALGIAGATYGLDLAAVAIIVVSSAAGGGTIVAAAEFQRRHRFALSLMLVQTPNYILLLAAVVVMALGASGAYLPLLVMTGGFLAAAAYAWWLVLRVPQTVGSEVVPWREALSLAATGASGSILGQVDRLVIPYVLPLSALATYGVLSSVAGSLFRVLQRGVGYALLPRLRAAGSVAERRRLVASEARVVAAIAVVGSLAIWVAMPLVEHWLLHDKYHFSGALVLATLLVGCAKILHAFTRATVTALADARELGLVNLSGWLSLGLSVLGAAVGARWGLTGVIYGVGLGWLFRAVTALAITYRHLRPLQQPATP